MWHTYIGFENVNLNQSQKQALIAELRKLGPSINPQPCNLNHWRMRLDEGAAIFEALFDENDVNIGKTKQWFADIFDIDAMDIDHSSTVVSFSDGETLIIAYAYLGTTYIRIALFGGYGACWEQSGRECRGYLKQYLDQWEQAEP